MTVEAFDKYLNDWTNDDRVVAAYAVAYRETQRLSTQLVAADAEATTLRAALTEALREVNRHVAHVAKMEALLREAPAPEDVHDCCGFGFSCMGGRQASEEYKTWFKRRDALLSAPAEGKAGEALTGHEPYCPLPGEMAKSPEHRRYGVYCNCKHRPMNVAALTEAASGVKAKCEHTKCKHTHLRMNGRCRACGTVVDLMASLRDSLARADERASGGKIDERTTGDVTAGAVVAMSNDLGMSEKGPTTPPAGRPSDADMEELADMHGGGITAATATKVRKLVDYMKRLELDDEAAANEINVLRQRAEAAEKRIAALDVQFEVERRAYDRLRDEHDGLRDQLAAATAGEVRK